MKNRQHPSWGSIVNDAAHSKVASQQLSKLLMDRAKKAAEAREKRLDQVINERLHTAAIRNITDICHFRDVCPIECHELIAAIASQYGYQLEADDISNAYADLILGLQSEKATASVRLEMAVQEAQWEAYWEKAQDFLTTRHGWKGGKWAHDEEVA